MNYNVYLICILFRLGRKWIDGWIDFQFQTFGSASPHEIWFRDAVLPLTSQSLRPLLTGDLCSLFCKISSDQLSAERFRGLSLQATLAAG